MTLDNDLRRQLQQNISRLRDMGTYRGRRHAMGLPARGQNTRTQVSGVAKWCETAHGTDPLPRLDFHGEEVESGGEERLNSGSGVGFETWMHFEWEGDGFAITSDMDLRRYSDGVFTGLVDWGTFNVQLNAKQYFRNQEHILTPGTECVGSFHRISSLRKVRFRNGCTHRPLI